MMGTFTQNTSLMAALREIESATVANAVEQLGVRHATAGFADSRLRPMILAAGPMVGYALTATVDSTGPGNGKVGGGVDQLLRAAERLSGPVVVVAQEVGPNRERGAHFGGIIGGALAARGAVGLVTDAGVRDLPDLRELGIHVFAAGTVVAHGTYTVTAVGVDIEVFGMPVRNGDLLHGGEDGLLTVPSDEPEKLLELCRENQRSEAEMIARLNFSPRVTSMKGTT